MNIGEIVEGKVIHISKTYIILELQNQSNHVSAMLHISEISDFYLSSIENIFQENKVYEFIIIDNTINSVKVSWKRITPRFSKVPFKFDIKETRSGFQNLKKFVDDRIENA